MYMQAKRLKVDTIYKFKATGETEKLFCCDWVFLEMPHKLFVDFMLIVSGNLIFFVESRNFIEDFWKQAAQQKYFSLFLWWKVEI